MRLGDKLRPQFFTSMWDHPENLHSFGQELCMESTHYGVTLGQLDSAQLQVLLDESLAPWAQIRRSQKCIKKSSPKFPTSVAGTSLVFLWPRFERVSGVHGTIIQSPHSRLGCQQCGTAWSSPFFHAHEIMMSFLWRSLLRFCFSRNRNMWPLSGKVSSSGCVTRSILASLSLRVPLNARPGRVAVRTCTWWTCELRLPKGSFGVINLCRFKLELTSPKFMI